MSRSSWERPSVGLNLQHVRATLGDELVDQVEEISQSMGAEVDTVVQATLPGDGRRLRGIPAVGRGVSGVVTDGHEPGSDEHLAAMDEAVGW